MWRDGVEPGVPARQYSTLTTRPPKERSREHRKSERYKDQYIYFVYASQGIQGRFEILKQVLTIF